MWQNILVGLVVGLTSGYLLHRLKLRRGKLYYDVTQRSSFPKSDNQPSVLKIERADGSPVSDPHEVTLNLRSTGLKDIKPDANPDDLKLKLGANLVAIVDTVGLKDSSVKKGITDTELIIEGQLLKRNKVCTVIAIVDGVPSPEFDANLADVDTVRCVDVKEVGRKTTRRFAAITACGFAAVLVLLAGLGWYSFYRLHQQQTRLQNTEQNLRDLYRQAGTSANGITQALPSDPEAAKRQAEALNRFLIEMQLRKQQGLMDGTISGGTPPSGFLQRPTSTPTPTPGR